MTITTTNFEAEVLNSSKPVLIDFWAPWCGPCRMQGPVLDALAVEDESIVIGKVNIDDEPKLAQEYGIMSIPTILVFKDGKVAGQVTGVQSKEALLALLANA